MDIGNIGEYLYISSFVLIRSVGEHSRFEFDAEYGENELHKLHSLVNSNIELSHSEETIFKGYISEISIKKKLSGGTAHITALSSSAKADTRKEHYVFQSTAFRLGDITGKLNENNLRVKFSNTDIQNIEMPEAVINNGISDFDFIKQLAGMYGFDVWVNDLSSENPELWLGEAIEKNGKNIELKNYPSYERRIEAEDEQIIITSEEYFVFSSVHSIDSKKYVLSGQTCELKNGLYIFTHTFKKIRERKKNAPDYGALYYEGTVKSVDDTDNLGRIQISFECEGIKEFIGDLPWINYLTPYAAGVYLMPAKGDRVAAVYSEGHFTAIGSLRAEKVSDEFTPETKNIGFDKENYICFKDGKLTIKSKSALLQSSEKISVEAENLNADSENVNIKGGKSVKIGNAKVDISGNNINIG